MIYRGTTMGELIKHLRDMDNNRTCEHIKTDDSINLKVHMKKEGIVSWESEMDTDEFLTEYPYAKGEGFDQLELFLKKLEKQMIDMPFAVLAHYQTKNRLSKDGKVVSRWYLVDPFGKTEEKDGDVVIPIKTFSLSKEEYRNMMETEIALYDMEHSIIYPFKKCSLPNLGKLLDCEMAFHTDCPLGAAMILADRLCAENAFCLIHRKPDKRIRPVIAVTSEKYQYHPQEEFFMEVIRSIRERMECQVVAWEIYDEETIVEVHLKGKDDTGGVDGFFIHAGDVPGNPMTITSFHKIQGNYIYLMEKSIGHKKDSYCVANILRSMWKSFSGFKRFYSELDGKIIKNPASIMENHLYPVIGSKRWKQIKECFKNDEAGEKAYQTLLEQTDFSFSRKSRRRTKQLRFAFYEILKDMVRISKKESVKSKESLISSIPIKCFMDEEGQYCLMAEMKT